MASKSLTFDIYGRDKSASKTIDGISGKAEGMGTAFKKAGTIIAAAAAVAVLAWAKTSVGSLMRIETINAQTESVLKSTGGAAKVSAQHIEDLATALEKKTSTEGEAIQEGANLLLTFKNIRNEAGKGNDIFDQTTSIMVDMARSMGTDASTGAIQLGKALNDPIAGIAALSKVGITFSEDQKALIKSLVESGDMMGAQKVILQELQDQFGGSGAAFADTFAGKVENIGNAWGEVGEKIFTKAMPALTELADWVIEDGIPALDDFLAGIEENKDVLGPAAIAVGGLTAAMWLLNVAMAANPIGLITAGIILLIGIASTVTMSFDTIWSWFEDHPWGVVLLPLVGGVGGVTFAIKTMIEKGAEINGMVAGWNASFITFALGVGVNITKAVNWILGLPAQITIAGVKVVASMNTMGADMVGGMLAGIASKAIDVGKGVKKLASDALQEARDFLDINSPSKKFRDKVGKPIGLGVAVGVSLGKPKVDTAIRNLVDVPTDSRTTGGSGVPAVVASAGSSRGGDTFNIHTPHDGAAVALAVQRRQNALAV